MHVRLGTMLGVRAVASTAMHLAGGGARCLWDRVRLLFETAIDSECEEEKWRR